MTKRLFAVAMFGFALFAVSATAQNPKNAPAKKSKRVNELVLAGLRPGRDTVETAEKTYKGEFRSRTSSAESPEWSDGCTGHFLRLELRGQGMIESVTVSSLGSTQGDCLAKQPDGLKMGLWRTGRGIAFGSTKANVTAIYGAPQSSGPSTQNGRELELMYYSFDWAGTDVPQVMEITLERGRVVQIVLAFPSL